MNRDSMYSGVRTRPRPMSRRRLLIAFAIGAGASALFASTARAQLEISSHTISAGGVTTSTGGNLELGGTIGQPDAQTPPVMSGGTYQLTGGFWPAAANVCTLPGDMNADGHVDGQDIQRFVNCLLTGAGPCTCADFNGGGVGASDVPAFVAALLGP